MPPVVYDVPIEFDGRVAGTVNALEKITRQG